ncbi:MAG: CapA family protein [Deltaproteobacteria bacterium]|nr:CapA family protein [Deltaproteobacteria bacterium]
MRRAGRAASAFLGVLIFGAAACDDRLADIPVVSVHEHLSETADAETLVAAMDEAGIERMVLLGSYEALLQKKKSKDRSTAVSNNRVVLDAAERYPDRFIPFVLIDPELGDPVAQLRGYLAEGARGVKLYLGTPSYRAVPIDADVMRPLYAFCEDRGIPILIHVNIKRYADELRHVLTWYPRLTWIVPHLLTLQAKPHVADRWFARFPNLYTDLSFGHEGWAVASFKSISKNSDRMRRLIADYPDRFLFGTDVCVTGAAYKTRDYLVTRFRGYREILERAHFTTDIPMNASKTTHLSLTGLALDDETLRRIYRENFMTLFENTPVLAREPWPVSDAAPVRRGLAPDLLNASWHTPSGEEAATAVLFAAQANFTQPVDDVSREQWRDLWTGKIDNWRDVGGADVRITRYAPEEYRSFLTAAWPDAAGSAVSWISLAQIAETLRGDRGAIAVVPVAAVDFRTKTLMIDGRSPFGHRSEDAGPPMPLTGAGELASYALTLNAAPDAVVTNDDPFDPRDLRTVMITGSSLVGQGMDYERTPPADPLRPLKKVAPWTRAVDIMHVSNECPLVENCVQKKGTWKFCSDASSLRGFVDAGVDVLELTGNHQTDFGRKAAARTFKAYKRAMITYYGGGIDRKDGNTLRVVNVRGTRFAFLGYNDISGSAKLTQDAKAGANHFSLPRMVDDVRAAREHADVVLVNMQWGPEFDPRPRPRMVEIAHRALDEGAAVLTGTHAHRTTAMEFYGDGAIFYGLGNFLFAHPGSDDTTRSLAVLYTFWKDRLVSVRPVGVGLNDFQSHWLTPDQEDALLEKLYAHSPPRLGPQATYDILAASVRPAGKRAFRSHEEAMKRAGIDEAVILGPAPGSAGVFQPRGSIAFISVPEWPRDGLNADTLSDLRANGAAGVWVAKPDMAELAKVFTALPAADKTALFINLTGTPFTPELDRLTNALRSRPVVLIGNHTHMRDRKALAALLTENSNAIFVVGGDTDADLKALADAADASPEEVAAFFTRFQDQLAVGFGITRSPLKIKSRRNEIMARYFRIAAWRRVLEEPAYRFPILAKRGSEWSYSYDDEPERRGLALPPGVLKKIYRENVANALGLPSDR